MKQIVVTGACGQIAYSFLFRAAHGDLYGYREPVTLHLYDVPGTEKVLEGVTMELEDCAFPLLQAVHWRTDLYESFVDADLVLLIGAKPRGPGMERGDLLQENGKIFVEQGKALNAVKNKQLHVIVVGNPCNTNCLIAMHHAPTIPRSHFHAMMRLDQNRAIWQLAQRARAPVKEISRMVIWGNHSSTQVPDVTYASIGSELVTKTLADPNWLQGEFITSVQKRGGEIIAARGKSSAASASNALVDAVRSLMQPPYPGEWFSSAVCSDNNPYGIAENLIFGFPCRTTSPGQYEIVPDLTWDDGIRKKIEATQEELLKERACVEGLLKQ